MCPVCVSAFRCAESLYRLLLCSFLAVKVLSHEVLENLLDWIPQVLTSIVSIPIYPVPDWSPKLADEASLLERKLDPLLPCSSGYENGVALAKNQLLFVFSRRVFWKVASRCRLC